MKRNNVFIIILLISLSLNLYSYTRNQFYRFFGPKIVECIVLVIKDEVNILRQMAGLPERTNEQVLNALSNKYDTISNYDWLNENGE